MGKGFGKGHKLHLVDGSGFIFRAYHALPPLSRSDGVPVGAVAGFCNMIFRMIETNGGQNAATHFAVIFDHKSKTFRSKIFPAYKANRPPPPDDLIPQFDLIKSATRAFNIPCIEVAGYEADDIIASYAHAADISGGSVVIISSDKDLMQLVTNSITMFDAMKNNSIDREKVFEKFGVYPEKVIEVQALAGDSVDNIPGAPGIGIKTAAQLVTEFGDIENLLDNLDRISQPKRRLTLQENKAKIRISKQLVTLIKNAPLPKSIDDLAVQKINPEPLLNFMSKMEFKTLSKRIISKFQEADGGTLFATSDMNLTDTFVAQDSSEPINFEPYGNYETISTESQLKNWIRKIQNIGYFSVDTETTSLNELKAELVGVSLAIEPGKACYIPLGHKTQKEPNQKDYNQLDRAAVLNSLKPLLESKSILKIGQNIKYDLKIFYKYGIKLNALDDTMLMSYALFGGLHRHNMDTLSERYLSHESISIKTLIGSGKTAKNFSEVPINEATKYAAEDADITLRLWALFKELLYKHKKINVYETLERPLIQILADMELRGILVNKNQLLSMSNSLEKYLSEVETEIQQIANKKFNVASPKQLGEMLFITMGLPGGKKSKNGTFSTAAEVLESLASNGVILAEKVLDWRQMSKLKSTYADALREHIDENTKRVHTSYNISGTSTGRLSSTDPNLQNIPVRTAEGRKIREAFIADTGFKLVSLDYSQIELRILAHIADIKSLEQAFRDELDIHALTASEMFNVPMNEMTPDIRRKAKAINFGVIYGISAFGLANNLRIPRDQAKKFIDKYFERFPGIQQYMHDTTSFASENGYVETIFGRRIYTPDINSKGHLGNFAKRAAINAPIQGSAADIIRRAMIKIPQTLKKKSLGAKMLLQVHDELIFEVPDNEIQSTITHLKQTMETACHPVIKLNVPLIVDAGFGRNWSEAH